MKERWDRGREVMHQTLELLRVAKDEQALSLLDDAITEAVREHRDLWISLLCSHAAAISHHLSDRQRKIHYKSSTKAPRRELKEENLGRVRSQPKRRLVEILFQHARLFSSTVWPPLSPVWTSSERAVEQQIC